MGDGGVMRGKVPCSSNNVTGVTVECDHLHLL